MGYANLPVNPKTTLQLAKSPGGSAVESWERAGMTRYGRAQELASDASLALPSKIFEACSF